MKLSGRCLSKRRGHTKRSISMYSRLLCTVAGHGAYALNKLLSELYATAFGRLNREKDNLHPYMTKKGGELSVLACEASIDFLYATEAERKQWTLDHQIEVVHCFLVGVVSASPIGARGNQIHEEVCRRRQVNAIKYLCYKYVSLFRGNFGLRLLCASAVRA